MLDIQIRERVENATVRLPRLSGQGVIVPGNLILTAAHCIGWTADGGMALGDNYHEEIEAQGKRLHVGPLAVEPISDIAVLGNLDSQEFSTWCGEFEAYCEDISPLEICVAEPQLFQWFDVFIFTHKRTWVHGKARKNDEHAQALFIEADEQIEGGTSGGPIVNGDGSLVGIVSTFYDQETDGKCDGMSPRPHLTMPLWLLRTACASFQIGE